MHPYSCHGSLAARVNDILLCVYEYHKYFMMHKMFSEVLFIRILMSTLEVVILHERFWRHAWQVAKELNMVRTYVHV